MSRRRRKPRRRKAPSRGVLIAQIVGLALALAMILFFRNEIALNAGQLLDAFGDSEDVMVEPGQTHGSTADQSPKKSER